ncbi:MAG TPA: TolC family protein [Nitrospirota bacterium]|nr:TolC family protein [Nitrospirota bacterium]
MEKPLVGISEGESMFEGSKYKQEADEAELARKLKQLLTTVQTLKTQLMSLQQNMVNIRDDMSEIVIKLRNNGKNDQVH